MYSSGAMERKLFDDYKLGDPVLILGEPLRPEGRDCAIPTGLFGRVGTITRTAWGCSEVRLSFNTGDPRIDAAWWYSNFDLAPTSKPGY